MTKLTKRNGTQEEFQGRKTEESLRRCGATDDVISKTMQRVKPNDGESTSAFRSRICAELKNHSPETARRYEDGRRTDANRSETAGDGTARVNPDTRRSYDSKPGENAKHRNDDKSMSGKPRESTDADKGSKNRK